MREKIRFGTGCRLFSYGGVARIYEMFATSPILMMATSRAEMKWLPPSLFTLKRLEAMQEAGKKLIVKV